MRVMQMLPGIRYGDGVSNDALQIQRLLEEQRAEQMEIFQEISQNVRELSRAAAQRSGKFGLFK